MGKEFKKSKFYLMSAYLWIGFAIILLVIQVVPFVMGIIEEPNIFFTVLTSLSIIMFGISLVLAKLYE